MYEVSQTLSSSLGLSETLDILARKLEALLPGTACLFLMHDAEGLAVRAAVGLNHEFFNGARTLDEYKRLAPGRPEQGHLRRRLRLGRSADDGQPRGGLDAACSPR